MGFCLPMELTGFTGSNEMNECISSARMNDVFTGGRSLQGRCERRETRAVSWRSNPIPLTKLIRKPHSQQQHGGAAAGMDDAGPTAAAAQQPPPPPPQQQLLLRHLRRLSRELRQLDVGHSVEVLHAPVDAAAFLREHVAGNKPALIKGAVQHWPALATWSPAALRARAGESLVSVHTTPNGLGDAVTPLPRGGGACFCTPHKRRMRFDAFIDMFFNSSSSSGSGSSDGGSGGGEDGAAAAAAGEVPYLQQQNSNLTVELPALLPDVEAQLGFAAAAFGAPPDAVNLWIGDERSATTFHKDHYENLYAVVRGTKVFHLLPPTDVYRMALQLYPLAQYEHVDGRLQPVLQQPPSSVMWCPVDPEPADAGAAAAAYPLFFDASLPPPLRVEVAAGDVLYLPACWYHYVQQRSDPQQRWCVAVNFWHDMRYDSRYASYTLVEALAREAGLLPACRDGEDDDELSEDGCDTGGEDASGRQASA